MPRFPLWPTMIVGAAILAMIGLGIWQLERRAQKNALIAQLARNYTLPPIAFPRFPVGDDKLFRRAVAFCLEPIGWQTVGGRMPDGGTGWRHIAECRTGGAEGPSLFVDVGVAADPKLRPQWRGGAVSGTITHAPDARPMLAALFDRTPKTLMIVADTPAPGLRPTARPALSSVPNNHLAYAVQWFLFALVAAIIYPLALATRDRARAAKREAPPPQG